MCCSAIDDAGDTRGCWCGACAGRLRALPARHHARASAATASPHTPHHSLTHHHTPPSPRPEHSVTSLRALDYPLTHGDVIWNKDQTQTQRSNNAALHKHFNNHSIATCLSSTRKRKLVHDSIDGQCRAREFYESQTRSIKISKMDDTSRIDDRTTLFELFFNLIYTAGWQASCHIIMLQA